VVAPDAEPALISAVEKHFPVIKTKRVLCFWHITKNVLTNCKALFLIIERWEEFEKAFKEVVFAKTKQQYKDIL
jgi:hypothetical protein